MKILCSVFSILSLALTVQSATTLSSVSGVSNSVVSATDGAWSIYGGIQGDNFTTYPSCAGGPCDTCTGANGATDGPCNPAGVFANTPITFNGTSSVVTAGSKWILCNSGTEVNITNNSTSKDVMLTTTWGELCASNVGTTGNSDCSTAFTTTTLSLGVADSCNNLGTEKVSIKFYARAIDIDTSSTYVDCPPGTPPAGQYGMCHFSLFPGDSKVYLEESTFLAGSSFPAVDGGPAAITTNTVHFFSEEVAVGEDDSVAYNRITNGKNSRFIPVSDPNNLGGTFLDDLTNDVRYCFRMASQDTAQNIEYFSPLSLCAAASCPDVCMTPSEVVGILSDKKCFIATAAFGSDMDQHVQMLRKFRNEFMAPHWIGRKLVKAYYAVSPQLASWIEKNESAKVMARWFLWPVMGWAQLALSFGWIVILAPFLLLILGFYLVLGRKLKKA